MSEFKHFWCKTCGECIACLNCTCGEEHTLFTELVKLRSQNARYKAALEFYADPEHWTVNWVEGSNGDYGKRAVDALKEVDDGR